MQETFSVVLNGPDCTKKVKEIERVARGHGKSRSGFMLWLYDEFVAKQRKKDARETSLNI